MPIATIGHFVTIFRSASDLTPEVWAAFESNPRPSNIMFPHALKTLKQEESGNAPRDQYWIACSTYSPQPVVDLVLSVTETPMGKYPIFIYSTRPVLELTADYLIPRLRQLIRSLLSVVHPSRVFSVFAPDLVTRLFVELWTTATGIKKHETYYHAMFSFCTKKTFINRQLTVHPDAAYELCQATERDTMQAAELCFKFASESAPFTLTWEGAIKEATLLIRNNQLWVHRLRLPGQEPEIASIVAITRTSDSVSAITKVYTNPRWRRRGCAERLVRRVCKHLLITKESVVLYVGHENPAAKVYKRVGFAGLLGAAPVEGADSWLEVGFDPKHVVLGHW